MSGCLRLDQTNSSGAMDYLTTYTASHPTNVNGFLLLGRARHPLIVAKVLQDDRFAGGQHLAGHRPAGRIGTDAHLRSVQRGGKARSIGPVQPRPRATESPSRKVSEPPSGAYGTDFYLT